MKNLFFLSWLILIAGCRSIQTLTPLPTPAFKRIGYHPALRPWVSDITSCDKQIPEIALGFYETPASSIRTGSQEYDLLLQFAYNVPGDHFVTQVGMDKVAWIVQSSNPIEALNFDQITSIYNGEITRWSQISDLGFDTPIELWIYPPEDPLNTVLELFPQRSRARLQSASLAPDPSAVLDAVAANPAALGYLPARWTEDDLTKPDIKTIQVNEPGEGHIVLTFDVLAITPVQPDDEMRPLVICLQSKR